jgi:hypothetical protein
MENSNFTFDFRDEQEAAAEVVPQEGGQVVEQESGSQAPQPSIEELLARISELENVQPQEKIVERFPDSAAAILQDKGALMELAKDYDSMPVIDLLRMDFEEKNKAILDLNPSLDKETAFRRFLQRNYNPDIEPLIEENLGLDEYDFAMLKSQVDEFRNSKLEKQASIQAALSGNFQQETDSIDASQEQQAPAIDDNLSMQDYEQRLLSHIESSLKSVKPTAMENMPEGFSIPSVGEDVLKEMINTLAVENLPLLVADDNNVYPNIALLKELADYRELTKKLPEMFNSFKEKIVAEAFENFKRGVTNRGDYMQAPTNPFSQDIVSPMNIGDNNITGMKI